MTNKKHEKRSCVVALMLIIAILTASCAGDVSQTGNENSNPESEPTHGNIDPGNGPSNSGGQFSGYSPGDSVGGFGGYDPERNNSGSDDAQNTICVDGSNSGNFENGTPLNPYNTIQAAVDAAANGDTIKIAKGTYPEAVQISQKRVHLLGGFAGDGDFTTADRQANITIIEGTGAAPCIQVYIDVPIHGSSTISGFTIRGGQRGIELSGGWSGELSNITIENNIIEGNGMLSTDRGGGIALEGNNVTIQNNLIRYNEAGRGAAIGVTDSLSDFLIADNCIEDNKGFEDHAGGVSICGTGTIIRNYFHGNVAAASYDYGWGGALLIFGDDNTETFVVLSYNVYHGNHAPSRGGAVFVDDGATVRMEHDLLYGNTSGESGAAIYVDADWNSKPSTLYMENCTVSGNSAGAALFVQASNTYIENCIFWSNGGDFELADNGRLSVDYTLAEQNYAGEGNISSDPLFADATGGDFHLRSANGRFDPTLGEFVNDAATSPAIDAGKPSSDYAKESDPNGGRINLGCYGNTTQASKSEG